MIKLLEQDGAWACYGRSSNPAPELPQIKHLLSAIAEFPVSLKDDRRSLVKRGELAGVQVIAKQPRDKNRRRWARFLSRFDDAEAKKTFRSLLRFEQLGIESVRPLCVLEKTQNQQVVDSWLLYEFRDGEPASAGDLTAVIACLKKLHEHGFRHEDPNFGNFLRGDDQKMFLIDCKGKKKLGNFGAYYDFMLLSLRNEGVSKEQVERLIDFQPWSPGYLLSRLYAAYIASRTKLKVMLRRRKSKSDIT